jgi:peptidoglycan hydrolase-like protein with peptidoglycan-binding domain
MRVGNGIQEVIHMTSKLKIFCAATALCLATGAASANDIIWQQPTRTGYHRNYNFEGNSVLYKDDVMKLQRALARRGYYRGRIDGIWGGKTTQALLDYQSVNDMPMTGTVTTGTLHDLGVNIDERRYNTDYDDGRGRRYRRDRDYDRSPSYWRDDWYDRSPYNR